MKVLFHIAMISLIALQAGCATIVSGKTQDVLIRSNPSGATVTIDEMVYGTTPLVANLVRKKRHSIHIQKEGYQDVTRVTTRGFNGWYLGNILLGGIIGLITDPITGAMYDVEPSEVNAPLPPADGNKAQEVVEADIEIKVEKDEPAEE